MLDVSEVINSPEFCQSFTVYRSTGAFDLGGWKEGNATTLTMTGVISVANQKELLQIPEGDRVMGTMIFHSTQELFVTHNSNSAPGTSDQILWNGERYKVIGSFPYRDYGYWKSLAVRMTGD